MSTENDPMAEIRATFFIECEELLEALQDGLQAMEEGGTDEETINIVFRAVHSIKGGAGAFGLEDLVRFAHRFESVLDAARSHQLEIDGEVLSVLFRAGDMLNDLVSAARDGEAVDPSLTMAPKRRRWRISRRWPFRLISDLWMRGKARRKTVRDRMCRPRLARPVRLAGPWRARMAPPLRAAPASVSVSGPIRPCLPAATSRSTCCACSMKWGR